jgi:large subunit ribosomal protein L9
VKVRLHAEVAASIVVNVARSADEAERQARGENVIEAQFAEDRAEAEAQAAELAANTLANEAPA